MLTSFDVRQRLGLPLTPFAFGDLPISENERDAQQRIAEIRRGNEFLVFLYEAAFALRITRKAR